MKNIKSERSTNINTFGENALYVVKAENRLDFIHNPPLFHSPLICIGGNLLMIFMIQSRTHPKTIW